eukprot:13731697-Alexandrium_andersonii.AAC.1
MSASLVGSEMCIRDRPGRDDLPPEALSVEGQGPIVAKCSGQFFEALNGRRTIDQIRAEAPVAATPYGRPQLYRGGRPA